MSSENAVTDEMKEYEANLSSSENVEPSGRFDSEMRIIVEDSIMTVSLDDGSKFEMLPSYSKKRRHILCPCSNIDTGNPLIPLSSSFVALVICIIVSEVFKERNLTRGEKVILMVTRSIGIYSFFGGVVLLLAIKFTFSIKCIWLSNRCISSDQQFILLHLKRFITGTVFEEIFTRQYIRRTVAVNNTDYSKITLDFLESEQMDEFVSSKLESFLSTPEGFILDSLNIDKENLQSYLKRTLSEVICDLYPLIFDKLSCHTSLRPESIKRHVDVMVDERLNSLGFSQLNKLDIKDFVASRKWWIHHQ